MRKSLAERLREKKRRRLVEQRMGLLMALYRVTNSGVLEEHGAKLVVFGSVARGEWDECSDLDLAVVGGREQYRLVGRLLEILSGSPLSPHIGVLEEMPERLKENILREGVEIHEFIERFTGPIVEES